MEIDAGSGDDVITTQSGALDLNVDAGAGDDSITVTSSAFAAADTVAGGDGTDTVTLSGAATLADADFANKTTVEALTAANATNSLTLGTNASDAGFTTVTGGTGDDTINAASFDTALEINAGSGDDVITAQSGAWI